MNKLLELFGVKNHSELIEFIRNNPDDARVKEVKELFEMLDCEFEEGEKIE